MRSADNGLEIELKFQVPAHRRAALVRALDTRTAERVDLRARYFDTADGRLAAAQLAWRLRLEDGRWVQTLKGRGDGLMQRLEHEVLRDPLDSPAGEAPALDLSLHTGTPAGDLLARVLAEDRSPDVPAAPLVVRHGTEIRRLKRLVRHAGAVVELALDIGDVVAGDRRAPVHELEMELVSGPVAAMLDLAARWAGRYALVLDPATKSERAQWLAQGLAHRPVVPAARASRRAGTGVAGVTAGTRAAVASVLAQALPNAAAITDGAHTSAHLRALHGGLQALSALQGVWSGAGVAEERAGRLFSGSSGTSDPAVAAVAPGAADALALLELTARTPSGAALARALKSPAATRGWLAWIGVSAGLAPS